MNWLSTLPVIGPAVRRLMTTHLWRAYERMLRVHWTRLAAAITFTSFVALFPLLTVAAAIAPRSSATPGCTRWRTSSPSSSPASRTGSTSPDSSTTRPPSAWWPVPRCC